MTVNGRIRIEYTLGVPKIVLPRVAELARSRWVLCGGQLIRMPLRDGFDRARCASRRGQS